MSVESVKKIEKEIEIDVRNLYTIDDQDISSICKDKIEYIQRRYVTGKCMVSIVILIVILSILLSIVLAKKTTTSPCQSYDSNSLASTVTVECLQYLWNNVCPTQRYTFTVEDTGWWTQSPQGPLMVSCINHILSSNCGVGSYGNILVYLQYCRPDYKG